MVRYDRKAWRIWKSAFSFFLAHISTHTQIMYQWTLHISRKNKPKRATGRMLVWYNQQECKINFLHKRALLQRIGFLSSSFNQPQGAGNILECCNFYAAVAFYLLQVKIKSCTRHWKQITANYLPQTHLCAILSLVKKPHKNVLYMFQYSWRTISLISGQDK